MKTALILTAIAPDENLLSLLKAFRNANDIVPLVICREGSGEIPAGIKVISTEGTGGKGGAIRRAFEYVRDELPECGCIIRAEANGAYDYPDIMHINRVVKRHWGTLVLGKRRYSNGLSLLCRTRNAIIRNLFAVASGRNVHDVETGLRGFGRELLDRFIAVEGDSHEYEVNILMHASSENVKLMEVDIEAVFPLKMDPYSKHIRQWIKVYACVMKFALSSLISFLIDIFTLLGLNSLLDGMHEVAALVISVGTARIISSVVNFYVNHYVVFKSKEPVKEAMLKFGGLQVIIMFASYALMHIMNIILNVPLAVSKVVSDTALFIVSFIVQGKFIYNKNE